MFWLEVARLVHSQQVTESLLIDFYFLMPYCYFFLAIILVLSTCCISVGSRWGCNISVGVLHLHEFGKVLRVNIHDQCRNGY